MNIEKRVDISDLYCIINILYKKTTCEIFPVLVSFDDQSSRPRDRHVIAEFELSNYITQFSSNSSFIYLLKFYLNRSNIIANYIYADKNE